MQLVAQFLEKAELELADEPEAFFFDVHLVNLIRVHLHDGRQSDRLEKPSTLRKLAKSLGWSVGEQPVRSWGMRLQKARLISLNPDVATQTQLNLPAQGRGLSMWLARRRHGWPCEELATLGKNHALFSFGFLCPVPIFTPFSKSPTGKRGIY